MATDITALLADGLSSLSFPTDNETRVENFELFSELPTELRLKIWSHALPTPTTLRLTAQILVADPDFGFYLTFFTATEGGSISRYHSSNQNRTFAETRSLSLLRAYKESRELYLENFPITLPFGTKGQGRLYISKKETLRLSNLSDLIKDGTFQRALDSNYRLQSWWCHIETLAVDVTMLLVSGKDWTIVPSLLRKLPALKNLKGVMWDGFKNVVDNGDAEGTNMIKDAMNAQLRNAERELLRLVEGDEGKFAFPEIRLMV